MFQHKAPANRPHQAVQHFRRLTHDHGIGFLRARHLVEDQRSFTHSPYDPHLDAERLGPPSDLDRQLLSHLVPGFRRSRVTEGRRTSKPLPRLEARGYEDGDDPVIASQRLAGGPCGGIPTRC